jgi:hypothetical protein
VVVRLSGEFHPTFTVVIESEDGTVFVAQEPVTMEEVDVEEDEEEADEA